ncbi:TPA: winged helix-turn-helix transcriptional regulator [Escherichia coli]|nr:winged helix-turn-helix transcriptional regulator [Escherichia coli]EFA8779039.1 winged helix-turn-helix transcriptional regulator [Escherichia coli O105]EGS9137630.1 winged helix-turn-helix transcriptional regulator [Escherichia coli]EHV3134012.1 winged helix-turn-helix transcriptional regulator [Escherichia coli]EHV5331433.1 winged helix-turn-helix transcriptional regulator [Escherichia coli]
MQSNRINSKKTPGRTEGSKYFVLIQNEKKKRLSQSKIANILGISLSTVKRYWANGIFG